MAKTNTWVLHDNTREFYAKLQDNEEQCIRELEKFLKMKMDIYVAVDTGYLKSRNKVKSDFDKKILKLENDANYSGFVEKGTYKMKAQPFMTPSVYNHIEEIKRISMGALARDI